MSRVIKRQIFDSPLSKYQRKFENDWWFMVEFSDGYIGFVSEDALNAWKNKVNDSDFFTGEGIDEHKV